ncbi:hypothetical protein J437_LFUL003420 [Ladona fulva]|uniref:Leucine-rich repeat-containing protein 27 n=1 Tax=Ladona fulva TaxID=123851 RepID=A0A8K0K2P3_LADFU|nr:hypothetical protein J437_LFUL003420 [Ladona fulva]
MELDGKNYDWREDGCEHPSSKHLDLSKSGLNKLTPSLIEKYPFVKSIAHHPSLEVILLQGNQIQELPIELEFKRPVDKIVNEEKEDFLQIGMFCRRNTTPCNQERIHYNLNRRRATVDDYPISPKNEHNNESNLLKPSQQIVPMCKSAIRVMTNPKTFTPIARKSAPNLNRHKSDRTIHKNQRNATTAHNKQILMKQDAIIQKRKNEEALKSWRDKMRAMNNKGMKPQIVLETHP